MVLDKKDETKNLEHEMQLIGSSKLQLSKNHEKAINQLENEKYQELRKLESEKDQELRNALHMGKFLHSLNFFQNVETVSPKK